jgi:uncharacterized protein (TIGR00369 family)
MRDVASDPDHLVVEMDVRPDLANIRGALQGGLVATLIDVVAGRLAMAATEPGFHVATADMTIRFIAPILDGPARATARIVRAGHRQVIVDVEVHDVGRNRLAATSSLAFAVLAPRG